MRKLPDTFEVGGLVSFRRWNRIIRRHDAFVREPKLRSPGLIYRIDKLRKTTMFAVVTKTGRTLLINSELVCKWRGKGTRV